MSTEHPNEGAGIFARRHRRLRILLATNALVFGAFVYVQFDPRPYEWLFELRRTRSLRPRPAVPRIRADVRALGGQMQAMGRPTSVLGGFGRSLQLFLLRLNGRPVDDAVLAHLVNQYGNEIGGLDLRNTPITDLGLAPIERLGNLKQLSLGNAKGLIPGTRVPASSITDAGLVHLSTRSQLTFLTLSGLPVTDEGLAALRDLPDLVRLDLSGTKVKGSGLGPLKSLASLNFLALDDTLLSDQGLGFLAGAASLQHLKLNGVPLTGAGLRAFEALPQLLTLEINGCGLRDEDVAEFRRRKPDVEVVGY
jgi:hypothetical protein